VILRPQDEIILVDWEKKTGQKCKNIGGSTGTHHRFFKIFIFFQNKTD